MKKNILGITVLGLSLFALSFGLTSCGDDNGSTKKIRISYANNYIPYDYIDDNGNADGYEIAILKEVDKLLGDYEFEYIGTSHDDVLLGTLQGKYDLGVKGIWITEERQKKYLFPKNPIAASIIGIVIRTETADVITDLPSFAKYSGKLVPIGAQNAQYTVIDEYNKANPNDAVQLVAGDSFGANDGYVWVNEGRYDAHVDIKLSFENNILKDGAPYADFKDKLTFVPYKGIPTWPIFNNKNQKLADAYDEAITKLKENGTLSELSLKYFGEDVSAFLK